MNACCPKRRFVDAESQGAKEITHQAGQARHVASAVPLSACHGIGIEKEVLEPKHAFDSSEQGPPGLCCAPVNRGRTGKFMGYTQWILVQDSSMAFGFVPDRQYGGFHAGNLPLRQVRPGEVRTVEVVLYLENRFVTDVLRVDHIRFPVLANGVRDPAAMEWELTLVADILLAGSSTRAEPAARRFAEHQVAGSFRWIPTASETKAIADMISRRAKRPLLGGSPIQLLG